MKLSEFSKKTLTLVFLLCLGLLISFPLKADEIDETDTSAPSPDNLVNAYYNRCVNAVFQDLAPETRQEFCACTSAHVKDALSAGELATMATGRGKPVDPQILATKIMAPCLSAPIDEIEYNFCMGDVSYAHMFKTDAAYNATCHCVSSGISRFVADYGADLMAYMVHNDASAANNPAESMRSSAEYLKERHKLHNQCLDANAHH